MTFVLVCLPVAAVSTSGALVLAVRRRRTLPRPAMWLFAVNLTATIVAMVLTILQASTA